MPQPNRVDQQITNRIYRQHLKDQRLFGGHLNTLLSDASQHAGRIVQDTVSNPGFGAVFRRVQYAESRDALNRVQEDLWKGVKAETDRGIARATVRTADLWDDINGRLGDVINVPQIESQFKAAAEHSVENIRSRYINDIDLAPSVYKNQLLANGMVDRVVNRGILLNQSAAEIAKEVRQLIRPDVQGGVSYAARRLGRTELNNAFHETTRRAGERQPWVEGMKWFLSGSHPRPDICNEYADQDSHRMGSGVFPSGLTPGKPHPQCLCYVTAVLPTDDQFVKNLFDGKYDDFLAEEGALPGAALRDLEVRVPKKSPVVSIPRSIPKPGDALRQAVKSGQVVWEPGTITKFLSSGAQGTTELVRFRDGTIAVRKTFRHSSSELIDKEILGARTLTLTGVPGPEVIRVDDSILMSFMPGKTAGEFNRSIQNAIVASDDGISLGLVDTLTGNRDRHSGNWLIDGDKLSGAIDHGFSFDWEDRDPFDNPPSNYFTANFSEFGDRWKDNKLTKEDVALVRGRLTAMKPEFKDRMSWYDNAHARLNRVEKFAKGTRNIIK